MKITKRLSSVIIAAAMVIGSISTTASAATETHTLVDATKLTFQDTQFYNSYAPANQLFGVAGSFHLFASDSIELGVHCNGNYAAPNMVIQAASGTNQADMELTYLPGGAKPASNKFSSSFVAIDESHSLKDMQTKKELSCGNPLPSEILLDGSKMEINNDTTIYKVGKDFIDFDKTFADLRTTSKELSKLNQSYQSANLKDINNSTIVLKDGVNVVNIKANDLKNINDIYISNLLCNKQKNNNHRFTGSQSLIINIDCAGIDKLNLNTKAHFICECGYCKDMNGEDNYYHGSIAIWNFYDSSKTDKLFSGTVSENAVVNGCYLAPNAELILNQNTNGTIVGKSIKTKAQSHRADFKGLVPIKIDAATTTEATTERKTEITTEKPTAAPTTTEKITEKPTTQEKTTEIITTTEKKTEAPTTTEKITEVITTTEKKTEAPTTQEKTTEVITTTEKKTEAPTTQEKTTEITTTERVTETPTTQEKTTAAAATTEEKTEIITTEEPKVEATTEEPAELEVTVTDEVTDEPVPGAKVEITTPGGDKSEHTTDTDGKVTVNTTPGNHKVVIKEVPNGYNVTTGKEVEVEVAPKEKTTKTITKNKKDAKKAKKALKKAYKIKTGEASKKKIKKFKKKIKANKKEVAAWISIKGTKIDYPVMCSGNNKYLHYTPQGKEDPHGALFASYLTPKRRISYNFAIYGHNMKDGSMFTDLTKYANKSFYKKHKYVKLATEKKVYTYEVVEVIRVSCNTKDRNVYTNFASIDNKKAFKKWQKIVKKNREYKCSGKYTRNDNLMLLSTCEYTKKNGRFIVICKQKR